jgi:tetratricopeptide (TPR) repeat protein
MRKWLYYIKKRAFDSNAWMWGVVILYVLTFICPFKAINYFIYLLLTVIAVVYVLYVIIIQPIWTSKDKISRASQTLMMCFGFYVLYLLGIRYITNDGVYVMILSSIGVFVFRRFLAWLAFMVTDRIGDALGNLIFGFASNTDVDPSERTFYRSIPEGHRKRGEYMLALKDLDEQLLELETDQIKPTEKQLQWIFEANAMKAEIYAEDLKDYDSAEAIVNRLIESGKLSCQGEAVFLNRLCDWRLKLKKDLDGAREALEQIEKRHPGSVEAMYASQRKNRLKLPQKGPAPTKKLIHLKENLGLKKGFKEWNMDQMILSKEIEGLKKHLSDFPLDWEAREKLASIYSITCRNVEAAVNELDYLLEQDGQPKKKIVQWLNMKADFYIREQNLEKAKESLNTIIDCFPDTSPAYVAERRIALLKNELERGKPKVYKIQKSDETDIKQVKTPFHIPTKVSTLPSSIRRDETQPEPVNNEIKESPTDWIDEMQQLDSLLAEHPNHWEARERLASIYAYNMGETEAAVQQIEILLSQAKGKSAQIARWLNLEADFYVFVGDEFAAKKALQRIGEMDPQNPALFSAKRRIACIQREIRNVLKKKKDEGFFIPKMVQFGTDVTPKAIRQNRERKEPVKSKLDEENEQRTRKARAELAEHLKKAGFPPSD